MQKKKKKEFQTNYTESRPLPIPIHVLCEALFTCLNFLIVKEASLKDFWDIACSRH